MMEVLRAEIAAKRKALQSDTPVTDRPAKYVKRGDREKIRREQESSSKHNPEERDKVRCDLAIFVYPSLTRE